MCVETPHNVSGYLEICRETLEDQSNSTIDVDSLVKTYDKSKEKALKHRMPLI